MDLNYAIFRDEPINNLNDLAQIGLHNKREKKAYKSNPDINMQLEALYETLDALNSKSSNNYPKTIKNDINSLLNKINDYTYHGHKGYDVIDEKCYYEFTFKKN